MSPDNAGKAISYLILLSHLLPAHPHFSSFPCLSLSLPLWLSPTYILLPLSHTHTFTPPSLFHPNTYTNSWSLSPVPPKAPVLMWSTCSWFNLTTGSHSLSANPNSNPVLTAGLTGSHNLTATQTGLTTSGLFSGMQLGSSLAPANQTTAPMAPMAGSLVQQHKSPTSTLQNQQLLSNTSSWQPNLTNQRAQTSLAPPLIPTQPQQQDSINTGMGWSNTIQGQNPHSTNIQGSFETHGQSTQSLMGWSSNIVARPQPQAASSATGWSQNIGTTQPQGSGTGMGMGWTGGMQGIGGSQPTAASVMIGVGQPLVPQNTSSVARQPSPQQHPAPGANPFADLSFLS